MRTTNQYGIDLIKSFEACRCKAYQCPAGIWTIGWGHTGSMDSIGIGRVPVSGDRITQKQADQLFEEDLHVYEKFVSKWVEWQYTTDNQFSALVSLAYNIGCSAFLISTVLQHHNAHNHAQAADAFLLYNKATVKGVKKILAGLVRRRAAEKDLYERAP